MILLSKLLRPQATALPPISTVYEDDFCEYKVTMESIYGCPMECHTSDHEHVRYLDTCTFRAILYSLAQFASYGVIVAATFATVYDSRTPLCAI
jgi:hypothetical protein